MEEAFGRKTDGEGKGGWLAASSNEAFMTPVAPVNKIEGDDDDDDDDDMIGKRIQSFSRDIT